MANATIFDVITPKWDSLQAMYGLRDKDKERIIEACQLTEEAISDLDIFTDTESIIYETVSELCYKKHWKMNQEQWDNFLACVKAIFSDMKKMDE